MANIDTQIDDGLSGGGAVRAEDAAATATTCDNSNSYAAGDDVTCVGLFEQ